MSRIRYAILVLLTCWWCVPGLWHAAQAQDASFDAALAAGLQQVLDEEFARQALRGISAAVYVPGEGMWRGVQGRAGEDEADVMTDSTHFAIASITKTFTGALILQLVEEGRLNLDDSLHQWIDPYQYINLDITIRQLLGHTSGLYNITDNPAFWTAFWAEPARSWTPEEVLSQFMMRPVLQPGRQFDYSNSNYHLLGLVANAVTDSSIASLMRSRFYNPYNLGSTFFTPEESVVGVVSDNWSDADRDGVFENVADRSHAAYYSMSWAAGGMTATASDMAYWAQALFAGDVLAPAVRDEMLRFTDVSSSTAFTGYGLSIMRFEFDGVEMWGHTGLKPGFISMLVYAPDFGISICVLINQDNAASTYAVVPRLFEVIANPVATSHAAIRRETAFMLKQNYPNPLRGNTVIEFSLDKPSDVVLDVLDVMGRRVERLASGHYASGIHRVSWQPRHHAGGMYFYRIQTAEQTMTRSMVYLK